MKRLEIPRKHFRGGKAKVDGDFLDRRSFAKPRSGGHHPLLAKPLFRCNSDSFFKNSSQMPLGDTDTITKTRHPILSITSDLTERERERIPGQQNKKTPVSLDDFYVAAFHSSLSLG